MPQVFCLTSWLIFGCSSYANPYGSVHDEKVIGSPNHAIVANVWNAYDPPHLAQAHCRLYGKVARFSHMEGDTAIFDCLHPAELN